MTSELSNALNPHVIQTRSRTRSTYPSTHPQHPPLPVQPAPPAPRPYVPHRSELELAIAEPPIPVPPPPPPPPPPRQVTIRKYPGVTKRVVRQPSLNSIPSAVNPFHEIIRVLAATRNQSEAEKKRRASWERQQEERFAQREAELEKQVSDMQAEILRLKSQLNSPSPTPSGTHTPFAPSEPATPSAAGTWPETPLSPVSVSFTRLPQFMEGSSRQPLNMDRGYPSEVPESASPATDTPSGLPLFAYPLTPRGPSVEPSSGPPTIQGNPRKRHTPPTQSSDDESSSDESDDAPVSDNPRKRRNGHDKSIKTIHVRYLMCAKRMSYMTNLL